AWRRRWGRSRGGLLGRSGRGVGSPHVRRLHPTGIRTRAAPTPQGPAAVAGDTTPGGPHAGWVPLFRPPGAGRSTPRGAVRLGGGGVRGRRRGLVPGGEGGGGACERDSNVTARRVAGLAVRTLGTGRQTASPLPRTPVHSRRRCSLQGLTSFFSFGGLGVWSGGIGVPSLRLAARVRAPDAHEGLAVVTVRCHWRSRGSVRRRVGSCVWLPFGTGSPIPPVSRANEAVHVEHSLGPQ